jgi:hypothetical protein
MRDELGWDRAEREIRALEGLQNFVVFDCLTMTVSDCKALNREYYTVNCEKKKRGIVFHKRA